MKATIVKKILLPVMFCVGLLWVLAGFGGLATQGEYDSLVVNFREDLAPGAIAQEVQAIAARLHLKPHLNSAFSQADNIYVLEGKADVLALLKQSELSRMAEAIEPNYIYRTTFVPNDPLYDRQWNLRSLDIESAWNASHGKGVTVAVIDTGVSRVADLKDTRFVKGYDFVNDREDAADDNGHGTHVAGTIAQSTNNNYGVAGIAYEANIMPLKVLSSWGGGTVADIAEAIRFAADNGAQVINMSLGGGGESSLMKDAIEYAYKKGVVIIAAAGNANSNAAAYPARYPRVIGVSATAPSSQKAFYSNYGAGVDIAAPGGEMRPKPGEKEPDRSGGILQNTINPKTGESVFLPLQGTSMAAPHVAGVAALVVASGVKNPDEVRNVLQQSARKVKDDGMNYYGAGQLDANAAIALATKGQLNWQDFFRWLRDNGYLNPRFWIDGGVVAIVPKILMVVGSYLLAWFLRNFFPFRWSVGLHGGLWMGSAGFFFLRGLYIFDLPQMPFRLAGSSFPELGNAFNGSLALNPISASILLPLLLTLSLLGNAAGKWFAIGVTIGTASCLAVSAAIAPTTTWLGEGWAAQSFLTVNALLCLALAHLTLKSEVGRA